jgi:hypothetical protein
MGVTTMLKRPPLRDRLQRLRDRLHSRQTLLWWLHSAWAFLFGVAVMLLGASNPTCLRIVIFHIAFIWLSSLFLPVVARVPWLTPTWASRIRLLVNYFNKNFYQQLLFFVLPLYYTSTTFWSRNVVFLAVLVASAVLSTLDVVYDRYVSVKWPLTAAFLSFNIFACIYVILMVLWSISSHTALHLSALLALLAFASLLYRSTQLRGRRFWFSLGVLACLLLLVVRWGAGFIPPATLSLGRPAFGRTVLGKNFRVVGPMAKLPAAYRGTVASLTPIKAPFGLRESVRHCWYSDGELLRATGEHEITGGRTQGFRFWSAISVKPDPRRNELVVEVETGLGQLIGRAELPAAH